MKINEIVESFVVEPNLDYIDNPMDFTQGKDLLRELETEVFPILRQHCSEILSLYKSSNRLLYRGVRISGYRQTPFFVAGIRDDRRPIELDPEVTRLSSEVIHEMGGVATRENSIFCTTDHEIAGDWGKTFIVFPKDGWQATYFENLKMYSFYVLDSIAAGRASYLSHPMDDRESKEKILSKFKTHKISFNKSNMLNKSRIEVLIHGHSYIGINIEYHNQVKQFIREL